MKTFVSVMFLTAALLASSSATAGRSNKTTITKLIVKQDHIAVYTEANTSACSARNMWILERSHANYDAMYRGFLASKLSRAKVDIVGTGSCSSDDSRGERISWAYVAE